MHSLLSFSTIGDAPDQLSISEATRRFAEKELSVSRKQGAGFQRVHFAGFGKLGLTGMSIPEQHGGNPVDSLTIAAVLFEIARCQLGPAIYLSVHLMVSRLLAAQAPKDGSLDAVLRDLASAKALAAFCLTEAGAGSDAAAIQTRARAVDGGFRLSGEKVYITSAGLADLYFVFARSDATTGKDGISAFLVERGASGLSFGAAEDKMGCEGSPIASVRFDDTPAQLVGAAGQGYRQALQGLAAGRVNIAACATALASRAIECAAEHLESRKQFGKVLAEFQALQFMISDMLMQLRASILLTREACQALSGNDASAHAAIAKCFATDAAMRITTDAVQLLGGAGYLRDFEVERLMRDAKMLQIVEGTNQIQRLILSKSFLKLP